MNKEGQGKTTKTRKTKRINTKQQGITSNTTETSVLTSGKQGIQMQYHQITKTH